MNLFIKKIQVYVMGIVYTCMVLWFFLVIWQQTEHHSTTRLDFPKRCHMHLINDNNDSLLQVSLLQNQKLLRDNTEELSKTFLFHTDFFIFEDVDNSFLQQRSYYITQRLFHTFPPIVVETQRLLL